MEQRLGRIVRQGNENDEVGIYNYVTKNTFDAYMMNIKVYWYYLLTEIQMTKT